MPPFLRFESPASFLRTKKGPQMGPFFQFILAESWGCPGMLRMPSGFKAWRLFAHGLQTLSRLLNARALSGSNPQPTFFAQKRTPFGVLLSSHTGGELGIRTPDALLGHTRLAGEHLRPLGQLSVTAVL